MDVSSPPKPTYHDKADHAKTDNVTVDNDIIELKPKMTLLNGVAVIVGSIIGSGIFVSPSRVLKNTGSVNMALVVWITSCIFSMIGAYCYAELGCMIKKTGADYAYIMVTLGPFLAFIRLWVESMIVRPCTVAIVTLIFSIYAVKYFFTVVKDVFTYAKPLALLVIIAAGIAQLSRSKNILLNPSCLSYCSDLCGTRYATQFLTSQLWQ